jgi:hypothetical protein
MRSRGEVISVTLSSVVVMDMASVYHMYTCTATNLLLEAQGGPGCMHGYGIINDIEVSGISLLTRVD